MVEPVNTIVENFQNYRGQYNINSVVGGLLLSLSQAGLVGGATGSATELKQDEAIALLSQIVLQLTQQAELSNSVQSSQTAIALLDKLTQQLDFANGVGAVQPSQTAIASSSVQEILPLSGIRKRVRITNHSATDSILIELNGDASTTQGQIIGAGATWESPGREEARSRITAVSDTENNVNISYQETIDFILSFEIEKPTFTNQNANLIDINYSIKITDSLGYLSSLKIGLYEATADQLIAEQTLTTGLVNGATIVVTFLQVEAVEKTFYILIETN